MDCMMQKMDGFDATRSIRAQESALGLPRVPIIALSAIIDKDVGRDALECGMDDALGKPFANEDLREIIRPWLTPAAVATRRSAAPALGLTAEALSDA
jgi:CheY-like chemotaxis protein